MRVFLAALMLCVLSWALPSNADAHSEHRYRHMHHYAVRHSHRASAGEQLLGPGLLHMLQSAQEHQVEVAFPTADTMGRDAGGFWGIPQSIGRGFAQAGRSIVGHVQRAFGDPRPRAWCGWYMRQALGVADRSYNLARRWAGYGRNAGGPGVGVLVVWPHHVGKIVGRDSNGEWIVTSGNDGHAVRTRPRSVAGAIAFRM